MTIFQAISQANSQRPNAFSTNDKVEWLREIEARIKNEIFDTHEELCDIEMTDFTGDNTTTTLIAPHPYDIIYIYWLFTKIDFLNGENVRFNSSVLMYNTAWINLANYANRNYRPKSPGRVAGA